jgi:hypothetical protein
MPLPPDPSFVEEKKAVRVPPGLESLSPAARRLLRLYHGGSFVFLGLLWLLVGIPSLWALRADLLASGNTLPGRACAMPSFTALAGPPLACCFASVSP